MRPLLVDDEPHGNARAGLLDQRVRETVADVAGPEAELVDVDRRRRRLDVRQHRRVEAHSGHVELRSGCARLLERERELSPLHPPGLEQAYRVLTQSFVRHADLRWRGSSPRHHLRSAAVVEAVVSPRGRYVLELGHFGGRNVEQLRFRAASTRARTSRSTAASLIRATSDGAVERARFMLALDDDHSEFVRRFRTDPLLGRTVRALPGLRPHRLATVAHALLRGICGQLIQSSRARQLERVILRAAGTQAPEQDDLARFAPARLRALGLATERASALVRVCRTLDLERLRDVPTAAVAARLARERTIGPWTCGVVVSAGLGRWDHGLVGDLGLVKLMSALRGPLGRAGRDGRAARSVRRVAGPRGRVPSRRLEAAGSSRRRPGRARLVRSRHRRAA